MSSRTSGIIRGMQLAERFNWKFYESGDRRILNERSETIVFVRSYDENLGNSLRKLGNRVGFDLLDRPVADQHAIVETNSEIDWSRYRYDIDFCIVNNSLAKETLINRGKVTYPVHVIPHHSVNHENKKYHVKSKVTKVGYVGLENQFSYKKDIEKFLKDKGIEFVMSHPLSRSEVSDFILSLDIGLICVESNPSNLWQKYILDYKPNTKLTNFQSFGTPTIAGHYSSFEEFGNDCWIKAGNKEEFLDRLENLIKDVEKRHQLSQQSYSVGQNYHIDNVKKLYESI